MSNYKLTLRTTRFKSLRKRTKLQINKYDTPAVLENSNQSFLSYLKYTQLPVQHVNHDYLTE